MTAITWKTGQSGDWSDAADWSTSTVPGASDDVTIAASGAYTVTILSAEAAHSLTLNNKSVNVVDSAMFSVGTSLALNAGTFTLAGGGVLQGGTVTLSTGVFLASGGTLSGVTFDGALRMNQANDSIYLAGTDSFTGTAGSGAGTILLNGTNALLYAEDNFTLNNATVTFGGTSGTATIYLDSNALNTPTLTFGSGLNLLQNAAGSSVVLDLYGYVDSSAGTVVNQGTITAAASGGTFTVYNPASAGVLVNQGAINVSNTDSFVLQAGTLANSSTGVFSLASGTVFVLSGGTTVSGGTIKDPAGVLNAQGGTLSGVSYNGTLNMSNGNALYLTGTDSLAGTAGTGAGVINLTGSNSAIYAFGNTTLKGATLNFGGASLSDYIYLYGSAPILTLGSTLNLVQSAASSTATLDLYSYASNAAGTFINQGTITASASGGAFSVYNPYGTGNFINQGAINFSGTDTFLLQGNLTNTSTGVLSLASGTVFSLSSGISGGTIKDTAGVLSAAGGTLSGVSYLGTLNLNASSSSISLTGLTKFGSISGTGAGLVNLTGSSAMLYALDNTTLNNAKVNFGGASVPDYIYLYATGSVSPTLTLGSTLALVQSAAGSTVDIDLTSYTGGLGGTVINQGTITASAKTGAFTVSASGAANFLNQGLIAVSNGDVFTLSTNATNTATGSFTTASAGVFALSSGYTLSNTGATLSLGSGAQLTLAGTVSGGTIKDTGGGLLSQSGTLNGVSYFGTLSMATAGYTLSLTGTDSFAGSTGTGAGVISLIGANAVLFAEDNTTLSNATMTIGGGGATDTIYLYPNAVAAPTLTLASNFSLVQSAASSTATIDISSYVGGAAGEVINKGTITASATSGSFNIYGASSYGTFLNQGTINASATKGLFSVSTASFINQGSINISGSETFSLSTSLANSSAGIVSIASGSVFDLGGADISGGTVKDSAGGLDGAGGTLSGLSYLGTLSVQDQLNLTGSVVFGTITGTGTGVINFTGNNASIFSDDVTTLSNAKLNFGAANEVAEIYLANPSSGNPTLTLASTFNVAQTATGSDVQINLTSEVSGATAIGTLVNNGTITASASGGYFTVYGAAGEGVFVNQGVIAISNHDSFSLLVNTTGSALGSFTTASGGIFDLGSGYVLSNTGDTLTLSTGAQLTLDGTIAGGTITDTGTGLITDGGTLSGVTYDGTLNVTTGNDNLYLTGTDIFAGSGGTGLGVINLTTNGASLYAQDQTTLKNATLNFGSANASDYIYLSTTGSTSTLTLGSTLNLVQTAAGSDVTIDLYSGLGYPGGSLINQGTITASASTGQFDVYSPAGYGVFTNQGVINVSNTDTFLLDTNVTSSTLGSFTTATGGVFKLDSGYTLSNSGATLSLGMGAQLTLAGAIVGGTIKDSGTGLVAASGTLSGVSYQGTLSETAANASLYVTGTETFAGPGGTGTGVINLTGSNATLFAIDATTLTNATLNFGGSNLTANIYLHVNSAIPTLTLGSSVNLVQSATDSTVSLDVYSYVGGQGGTLVNQGTITASASGGAFYVYNGANNGGFINQGVINVSNTDQFILDTSLATSAIGSFTTASGGVLKLDSNEVVSNTGATLSVGSGNQLTLAGIINGGTISDSGIGIIGDGGTLNGVSYQGTLSLTETSAQLTVAGVSTFAGTGGIGSGVINLTGGGASLYAQDKTTLSSATMNFGAVNGSTYLYLTEGSVVPTLTVGSSFNLVQTATGSNDTLDLYSYTGGNGGTLINQGTISANASGGTFDIYGGNISVVTNQGTLSAGNGDTLDLSTVANLTNLKSATLTGGTYSVGTNGTLFMGGTGVQVDHAFISLSGTNSVFENLNTSNGATNTLDSALYSIVAGGTLSLAGGRNFTATSHGGTFSDAGLLSLAGVTFAATALTVAAGGTLSGAGTLAVATTDTGLINASGGTLVLSKAVSGAGTLAAATNAVLDLTTGGSLSEVLAGAGTLLLTGSTAYSLAAVSTDTIATLAVGAGATLSATGSFGGGLVDSGLLSIGTGTLSVAGPLSGAGSIAIAAGTTLDLSGGGTFGGTISGAGTLILDGTTPFVLASGASIAPGTAIIDAGATLDLTNGGTLPTLVSGAGTLKLDGTTPYTLASGSTLIIGTLAIDSGASLGVAGAINATVVDSGSLTVTAGTLMLGALSGTGVLSANTGTTLDLTAGGTLTEQIGGSGTLLLTGTTPYLLSGGTVGIGSVAVGTGSTLSGTGTISSALADAGTVSATGGTLVLAGILSGTGAVTAGPGAVLDLKAGGTLTEVFGGTGTLQLDSAGYTLQGGTLSTSTVAVSAGATLSGYGVIGGAVTNAGTLFATGGTGTLAVLGAVTGAGALVVDTGAVLDLKGGGTLSGGARGIGGKLQLDSSTFTLAGATLATKTFAVSGGATLTGRGSITSTTTNAGSIAASGGTLTVSGALGGTGNLGAGTAAVLDLKGGGAIGGATGAGKLQLDSSTYTLSGGTIATGSLAVDAGAALTGTGTISATTTDAGSIAAGAGTLVIKGALTGVGSLSAIATGVLDLTAGGSLTETVTGAGTLLLAGAYTLGAQGLGIAQVSIATGAALSGTGTVTGDVENGGTLTATSGTLSIGGPADEIGGSASLVSAGSATLDLLGGGVLTAASGTGTLKLDGATGFSLVAAAITDAALVVDSGSTLSGTGTITGAVTESGTIAASGGLLALTGAISGTGFLQAGSGATLDLSQAITLGSNVSGTGTLELGGADTLGATSPSVANLKIDTGASLSGAGTLASIIANAGTMAASGGTLALTGAISGTGLLQAGPSATIDLTAGGTLTNTVSGTGTLELGGVYALGTATVSVSNLAIDAGAALSGLGTIAATIANAGTLIASGAGTLKLAGPVSGTGLLQAAAGATLDLAKGITLSKAVSGAGTLELGGASTLGITVPTIANIKIDAGASLSGSGTLAAVITNAGSLAVTSTAGTLLLTNKLFDTGSLSAGTGDTMILRGGGTVSGAVSGAGTVAIAFGLGLAGNVSLSASHILDSANVTVSSGTTITEAASSIVTLSAAAGAAVSLAGPTSSYSNAGTVLASGTGTFTENTSSFVNTGLVSVSAGTLSFLGTVTNTGTLLASGGLLSLAQTLAGTGTLQIGATGLAALGHGAAVGQIVDFMASTGGLNLTTPNTFAGAIHGFASNDTIDLINTAVTGSSFSNGVLTVINGSMAVASLNFGDTYNINDFSINSDGHSGALIKIV